jgi:steroid 5-alpha reductase family enzyme
MSPVIVCLWILAAVCVVTWVLSLLTKEYSWVDRIWSIIPVVYVWVYAIAAGLTDPRLDVMAALVTLWGARLTFNFARKGGYAAGGEDYRWALLRSRIAGWKWFLFNLFFIVIYQNVLIFLFTLPAWTAYEHQSPFTVLDVVAAVVFLVFLIGESVADQQQWDFHTWKASEAAAGRQPNPRFLQSGLFRFSRHPNFFFEQAQWWVFFFFGAIAARSVLEWTVLGALLLTVLFIGSTIFTESITRGRYPEYAEYQATTSAVVPWLPKRRRVAATSR